MEKFVVGGRAYGAYPYLEFLSVQGITFWSKYLTSSTSDSIRAVKYVESGGSRYVVVLFHGTYL